MKDKRITQMKFRAERDLKITHAAMRLILRACSHVYVNPHRAPESEFALTWLTVASWTGCGKKQAYRLLDELAKARYLKFHGLQGSPPQQMVSLWLIVDKNVHFEGDKNVPHEVVKNVADHISNPLGNKIKRKRGNETAPSAEERYRPGFNRLTRSSEYLGEQTVDTIKDASGAKTGMLSKAERRAAWSLAIGHNEND